MFERLVNSLSRIRDRVTLAAITRTLKRHPEIEVRKIDHDLESGFFWYRFQINDHPLVLPEDREAGEEMYGLGAAFCEPLAIICAWAELLERYSFFVDASVATSDLTTNGYATHTSLRRAKTAANAELIERDVLLVSWLLRLPAIQINPECYLDQTSRLRLNVLKDRGFQIKFGLLGKCMEQTVGIAFVSRDSGSAIVTAAKPGIKELVEHLTVQSFATVASWLSADAPTPIEQLPVNAVPNDHLRYYLDKGQDTITRWFLTREGEVHEFGSFNSELIRLTDRNPYALESGFDVFRSVSHECQNLWIGESHERHVNIPRLTSVSGRQVNYEQLNTAPHPLP